MMLHVCGGHAKTALPAACVSGTPATRRQSAPLHLPEPWCSPPAPGPHPDIVASTQSPGLSTQPPPAPGLHQPPPHHPLPAWTRVPSPHSCRGPAAHVCNWAPSEQTSPPAPQPCCPSSPLPHPIHCPPGCSWVRPSLGHQPPHRTPQAPTWKWPPDPCLLALQHPSPSLGRAGRQPSSEYPGEPAQRVAVPSPGCQPLKGGPAPARISAQGLRP